MTHTAIPKATGSSKRIWEISLIYLPTVFVMRPSCNTIMTPTINARYRHKQKIPITHSMILLVRSETVFPGKINASNFIILPVLSGKQTQGQQPPHRVASDARNASFSTPISFVTCVTCVTGRREQYFYQPLAVASAIPECHTLFLQFRTPAVHHLL